MTDRRIRCLSRDGMRGWHPGERITRDLWGLLAVIGNLSSVLSDLAIDRGPPFSLSFLLSFPSPPHLSKHNNAAGSQLYIIKLSKLTRSSTCKILRTMLYAMLHQCRAQCAGAASLCLPLWASHQPRCLPHLSGVIPFPYYHHPPAYLPGYLPTLPFQSSKSHTLDKAANLFLSCTLPARPHRIPAPRHDAPYRHGATGIVAGQSLRPPARPRSPAERIADADHRRGPALTLPFPSSDRAYCRQSPGAESPEAPATQCPPRPSRTTRRPPRAWPSSLRIFSTLPSGAATQTPSATVASYTRWRRAGCAS